jgi:hypothetical protein
MIDNRCSRVVFFQPTTPAGTISVYVAALCSLGAHAHNLRLVTLQQHSALSETEDT